MAADRIFAFRIVTTLGLGGSGAGESVRGDLQWIQTSAVGTFNSPQMGQFMDFNSARGKREKIVAKLQDPSAATGDVAFHPFHGNKSHRPSQY
ncbi:MAG: hypothetical protein U0V70_00895 [Terriglobia bacterium]